MECGHSLCLSKSQLKKNWVIIHLLLYYLWGFACILYHSTSEILCLEISVCPKKNPKRITCYVFKKQNKQIKKRLSLCCQWAEGDLTCQAACFSSPGSLLTWGTVIPSVFPVGDGFRFLATCRDCKLAVIPPDLPVYRRWPALIPAAQLSRACSARALTSARRKGWQKQTDNTSHSWLTFKKNTRASGTGMPAPC